jgi:hypothetical protein
MDTFKEENERINLSVNMQECVDKLLECYKACSMCLQHCLAQGGKHVAHEHISLLLECSDICRTSAAFLMSESNFAHELCGICARVCDACADSCHFVDQMDLDMQSCVEACRNSAESCRNMEH